METHPGGNDTSEPGKTEGYLEAVRGRTFVRLWNKIPDFDLQNSKLKGVLVHLL